MSEFKKLPLSSVCNHKLIYGSQDNIGEDIGIEGTYIAESDMKIKSSDIVDGIPFDICFDSFDNIECDGQQIAVDFAAERLHVLGFSLWCDVHSVIKLVYADGSTHCVKVPFIEWRCINEFEWFDIAAVGGDIKSHCVISSGKQSQPVYFHHIAVDIPNPERIKGIILPENFCLHIFSITLESVSTSKEENK